MAETINILYVSFYGALWGGSFIPSLLTLEREAFKLNAKIVFVFPEMGKTLPWAHLFPQAIWLDNSFFLKRRLFPVAIHRLNDIIKQYHITHVVTNFVGYNPNLLLCRLCSGKTFIQVVHNTFHQPSPNRLKKKLKLLLLTKTYHRFVGVSKWVADSMVQNGLPPANVTFVNNAVCLQRLEHYEELNFRQTEDEFLIFMFGWPYRIKGVDLVVRAVKQLRANGINAVLITPHHNIKSDICADIGFVPSFVRFVRAREDVATFYNNTDVFVVASREEGLSYAVLEAGICRSIVCASDIPSVSNLNIPGIVYFKNGDPVALYQRLKYISEHRDECFCKKKEQRVFIEQEFAMEKWSKQMLDTILESNKQ